MVSGSGRCWTPTSLWKELREQGQGTHKVRVTLNSAGDIDFAEVL